MNNFQQTVVIIAIILILCLAFSAISLHNHQKRPLSRQLTATCPDYWVEDDNGVAFLVQLFQKQISSLAANHLIQRTVSKCHKHRWAKGCNLTWDEYLKQQFSMW